MSIIGSLRKFFGSYTLPWAEYSANPIILADAEVAPLQSDSSGNLKVSVESSVPIAASFSPATRVFSATPAFGTSQILLAAPGTLFGISVQLGTGLGGADTMASGTYWIILVDLAAVPASGAVTPKFAWQVDHTLGIRDTVTIGDEAAGCAMTTGAVLLLSTTGPAVYTASGAYMLATATVAP